MNKDYISYNIAKLAKEKGFDENCYRTYSELDKKLTPFPLLEDMEGNVILDPLEYNWKNSLIHKTNITASTIWDFKNWLKEKYNIEVNSNVNFYNGKKKLGYYCTIDKFDKNDIHDGKDYDMIQMYLVGNKKAFDTQEEAYNAAFKYVLNKMI